MKTKSKQVSRLTLSDIIIEHGVARQVMSVAWEGDNSVRYIVDINNPETRICATNQKVTVLV